MNTYDPGQVCCHSATHSVLPTVINVPSSERARRALLQDQAVHFEEELKSLADAHDGAMHVWGIINMLGSLPAAVLSGLGGYHILHAVAPVYELPGAAVSFLGVAIAIKNFFKPNEQHTAHFKAKNDFEALHDEVRRRFNCVAGSRHANSPARRKLEAGSSFDHWDEREFSNPIDPAAKEGLVSGSLLVGQLLCITSTASGAVAGMIRNHEVLLRDLLPFACSSVFREFERYERLCQTNATDRYPM